MTHSTKKDLFSKLAEWGKGLYLPKKSSRFFYISFTERFLPGKLNIIEHPVFDWRLPAVKNGN